MGILVVDDELEMRAILCEDLQVMGLDVVTVASGAEALAALMGQTFDAVISDINMPGLDGLQLLAHIRERGDETPVIMLTAYGTKDKTAQALRLGAFDFLEKPYDVDVLRKTVTLAAALAIELRAVERELDAMLVPGGLSADAAARIRTMRRAILRLRKQRGVLFGGGT